MFLIKRRNSFLLFWNATIFSTKANETIHNYVRKKFGYVQTSYDTTDKNGENILSFVIFLIDIVGKGKIHLILTSNDEAWKEKRSTRTT